MPEKIKPKTKAEMIYAAERSGAPLTVYFCNGRYHIIPTSKETAIPLHGVVVHRVQVQEERKVFRYMEGPYDVREEVVVGTRVVETRRYRIKPKVPLDNREAEHTGYNRQATGST